MGQNGSSHHLPDDEIDGGGGRRQDRNRRHGPGGEPGPAGSGAHGSRGRSRRGTAAVSGFMARHTRARRSQSMPSAANNPLYGTAAAAVSSPSPSSNNNNNNHAAGKLTLQSYYGSSRMSSGGSKENSLYKAFRKRILGKHYYSSRSGGVHSSSSGGSSSNGGLHSPKLTHTFGGRRGVFHGITGLKGSSSSSSSSSKASKDHAKVFRELVSSWSPQDLHCLVVEYEASAALRELKWRADAARSKPDALKDDLGRLYSQSLCTDTTLVFDGVEFPVHAAFLANRSTFFAQLFRAENQENCGIGNRVQVRLPRHFAQIDAVIFGLLLQYLYTGEINTPEEPRQDIQLILRLKDEFGCPNRLDYDAYNMLQNVRQTGDAILVFVSNNNNNNSNSASQSPLFPSADEIPSGSSAMYNDNSNADDNTLRHNNYNNNNAVDENEDGTIGRQPPQPNQPHLGLENQENGVEAEDGTVSADEEMSVWRQGLQELNSGRRSRPLSLASSSGTPQHNTRHSEFRCHSSILAARSPFFRSLIQKRLNEKLLAVGTHDAAAKLSEPIQIHLDESVIPRIYAPVLLHALYTDQVDLTKVIRGFPVSVNSLSEVQAIASGKCQVSPIDEATEIFQIAQFLELGELAYGCESIVVEHVSAECLVGVYNWSVEPHGSQYVRRHCVNYLCREFARLANTPLLFDLEEPLLYETLSSDFVQASELEILQAVLRWGEHQLMRRLEEREPNLISSTTHSITRKGYRRSDLNDLELKGIIANLIHLVRTDYILPPFHQALVEAMSRGLVSCPPLDLPGAQTINNSNSNKVSGSSSESSSRRGTFGRSNPSAAAAAGVHHNHGGGGSSGGSKSKRTPPLHTRASSIPSMGIIEGMGLGNPDGHWLHPHSTHSNPLAHRRTPRPRFFIPYAKEARNQLHKKLQENPEEELLSHDPANIQSETEVSLPDALYMVKSSNTHSHRRNKRGRKLEWLLEEDKISAVSGSNSDESLDQTQNQFNHAHQLILDNPDEQPLPVQETIEHVEERVKMYLRTSSTVESGLACGCRYHRQAVLKQIRLRGLRDLGCPDSSLRILRNPGAFYPGMQSDHDDPDAECFPDDEDPTVSPQPHLRCHSQPMLQELDDPASVSLEGSTGQLPDLMTSTSLPRPSKHQQKLKSKEVKDLSVLEVKDELNNGSISNINHHHSSLSHASLRSDNDENTQENVAAQNAQEEFDETKAKIRETCESMSRWSAQATASHHFDNAKERTRTKCDTDQAGPSGANDQTTYL